MRDDRDSFMAAAGDLEFEWKAAEVSGDADLGEPAFTTNTSILSIFCC